MSPCPMSRSKDPPIARPNFEMAAAVEKHCLQLWACFPADYVIAVSHSGD